jgi:CheY-like chemotaxis protein
MGICQSSQASASASVQLNNAASANPQSPAKQSINSHQNNNAKDVGKNSENQRTQFNTTASADVKSTITNNVNTFTNKPDNSSQSDAPLQSSLPNNKNPKNSNKIYAYSAPNTNHNSHNDEETSLSPQPQAEEPTAEPNPLTNLNTPIKASSINPENSNITDESRLNRSITPQEFQKLLLQRQLSRQKTVDPDFLPVSKRNSFNLESGDELISSARSMNERRSTGEKGQVKELLVQSQQRRLGRKGSKNSNSSAGSSRANSPNLMRNALELNYTEGLSRDQIRRRQHIRDGSGTDSEGNSGPIGANSANPSQLSTPSALSTTIAVEALGASPKTGRNRSIAGRFNKSRHSNTFKDNSMLQNALNKAQRAQTSLMGGNRGNSNNNSANNSYANDENYQSLPNSINFDLNSAVEGKTNANLGGNLQNSALVIEPLPRNNTLTDSPGKFGNNLEISPSLGNNSPLQNRENNGGSPNLPPVTLSARKNNPSLMNPRRSTFSPDHFSPPFLGNIAQNGSTNSIFSNINDNLPNNKNDDSGGSAAQKRAARRSTRGRGRGKKLALVVDNVSVSQRLNSVALYVSGYAVSVAESGELALEMARAHHYDIILIDMLLPALSGLEVCGKLRELEEEFHDEPSLIIALTTAIDPRSLNDYKLAKFNCALEKGCVLSQVLAELMNILAKNPNFLFIDSKHQKIQAPKSDSDIDTKLAKDIVPSPLHNNPAQNSQKKRRPSFPGFRQHLSSASSTSPAASGTNNPNNLPANNSNTVNAESAKTAPNKNSSANLSSINRNTSSANGAG